MDDDGGCSDSRSLSPPPHLTLLSLRNDNAVPPLRRVTDLKLPSRPCRSRPDDWWSEDATYTLIHEWGRCFLHLNRGKLSVADWQSVANAVNRRHNTHPKTYTQCKNRVGTLKKKYKSENSNTVASSWPFFKPLDALLGRNYQPLPLRLLLHPRIPKRRRSGLPSCKNLRGAVESDGDSFGGMQPAMGRADAFEEVAEAVLRFGDVYERMEISKMEQLREMERQRMEFVGELEMQWMEFYMKTQMELLQIDKRRSGSKKRRVMEEFGGNSGGQNDRCDHYCLRADGSKSNSNDGNESDREREARCGKDFEGQWQAHSILQVKSKDWKQFQRMQRRA